MSSQGVIPPSADDGKVHHGPVQSDTAATGPPNVSTDSTTKSVRDSPYNPTFVMAFVIPGDEKFSKMITPQYVPEGQFRLDKMTTQTKFMLVQVISSAFKPIFAWWRVNDMARSIVEDAAMQYLPMTSTTAKAMHFCYGEDRRELPGDHFAAVCQCMQ